MACHQIRLYQMNAAEQKILHDGEVMEGCTIEAMKRVEAKLGKCSSRGYDWQYDRYLTTRYQSEIATKCGFTKFDVQLIHTANALKAKIRSYEQARY